MFKRVVKWALGPVARRATRWSPRIVMYHRFGPSGSTNRLGHGHFERQLRYLKRHFQPTTLSEITKCLSDGIPLSERAVAVTVDDGYRDFLEFAYPLLERYQVPATLFLVSDFIQNRSWLWFDAIRYLLHQAPGGVYEIPLGESTRRLHLDSPESRNVIWNDVADACLRLETRQREAVLSELQRELRVTLPGEAVSAYAPLCWDDAQAMNAGLVEFGSHTCSHPILSKCDRERKQQEIWKSKAVIEHELGREIRTFCYPNGQPGDYDAESVSLVREAGYRSAVVAHGGLVSRGNDLFRLARVPTASQFGDFVGRVNGVSNLRVGRHRNSTGLSTS